MAKRIRYELYEGDGEIIPGEYTGPRREADRAPAPGQAPDGHTEQARYPEARRQRYFASNEEDDGLGAPATLFDDFDRFNGNSTEEWMPKKRHRTEHPAAWAAVSVICLIILVALGILMFPQLTGIPLKFMPTIAFANGSIVSLDETKVSTGDGDREMTLDELLDLNIAVVDTDRIYPGVYIDNVHVGGMTREEAIAAVEAANVKTDTTFDIVVVVGNESWHVNNDRVPFSRNVIETVEKAWAVGRTLDRGSSASAFEQRLSQASALRSYPVTFTTKQDYDHKALRAMVDGIVNYVNRDPVNSQVATFDFSTKKFTFTEEKPGARLDGDALYTKLCGLLDSGVTVTTVNAVPEKVLPDMTRAELMNRFGRISTYSTKTTKNKNRNTNIDLSARAINGKTVLPGEIFSFNGATGERTAAKGYKEATAISGGATRDEIGGGVCQTSSTLFNAAVRADLEIIERNPHAWPSSYITEGFDATVNWPGLDMKFRNNTDWPIFIVAWYENQKVTVEIYGMSLGADVHIDLESKRTRTLEAPKEIKYVVNTALAPGESKTTVSRRTGCEVQTWKIWYQGDRKIKEELLFTTTYKPYQETVEYNPL